MVTCTARACTATMSQRRTLCPDVLHVQGMKVMHDPDLYMYMYAARLR